METLATSSGGTFQETRPLNPKNKSCWKGLSFSKYEEVAAYEKRACILFICAAIAGAFIAVISVHFLWIWGSSGHIGNYVAIGGLSGGVVLALGSLTSIFLILRDDD